MKVLRTFSQVIVVGVILTGAWMFPAMSAAQEHNHAHANDHEHSHDHGAAADHHGAHSHDHGHPHAEGGEAKRGPHGGKLLQQDDFMLELTIFEEGVPPQFRLYPFSAGKPVAPAEVEATIVLTRFGGKKEAFQLSPEADYLVSSRSVEEPHSFAVTIRARFQQKNFDWSYETHEGRTELSDEALKIAKLEFAVAGPQRIAHTARVYGRILPDENRVAHIFPRFAGVVKEIRKSLGDPVAKGEVLAVVESNQGLQPYEIRSQVAGIVIKRHATLGEFVPDTRELLVVADFSEVWADFQVYRDDFGPIEKGQKITVDFGDGSEIPATVTYISPLTDEVTQSKLIRATLPNPDGTLRPGLFISGVLSSADDLVAVAVTREALQTFRDWDVVYLSDGHIFQAVPVTLGRRDSKYVEILSGMAAGDRYVARNSFIVKADIEKAGASHDH